MLDSSGPFSFLGYSSGMRTIMEFAPFFFLMLGAFSLIAGVVYFVQGAKPVVTKRVRIIEKNGISVVVELENGTRETLVLNNGVAMVVGDVGIVECKGNFIMKFQKM